MKAYCYSNGKVVTTEQAGIPINDIGLLRGYGVFDLLRTYRGVPFHFDEHFARLVRSARTLGLRVPVSRGKLESIVAVLLKKNKFPESNIRIVLTGGKVINGMQYDKARPTFFVLVEPLHVMPQAAYQKGVKLITHEYRREFPQAKTLSYLTAVALEGRRRKEKAFEALYVWQGKALEASTSNIFMFRGNNLVTPKDDILIGVTRTIVLKLAKSAYDTRERDISVKELLSADEAFITATNKAIIPVVNIDGVKINDGKIGKHTRYLMDVFAHYTLNNDLGARLPRGS